MKMQPIRTLTPLKGRGKISYCDFVIQ